MKKYDYYRSASSGTKRSVKVRKKRSVSFLKPILLFCFFVALCLGGYWAAKRAYAAISAARMGQWKPSAVVISGVEGSLLSEISAETEGKINQPFSSQDAQKLQSSLVRKYPQLRRIQVQRSLFTSKLKISVKRRTPIARFTQEGQEFFMDEDGTVYADPHPDPLLAVTQVELIGQVPQNLGDEFAEFVSSVLKLKKQLHFSNLRFDLKKDTVTMFLPDGSVLDFGAAKSLRQKTRRAAQIQAHAQQNHLTPYELDFTYFEDGKVFLRQKAR